MKLNTNSGPRTNQNEKRRDHPRPVEADFESTLHGSRRPRLGECSNFLDCW